MKAPKFMELEAAVIFEGCIIGLEVYGHPRACFVTDVSDCGECVRIEYLVMFSPTQQIGAKMRRKDEKIQLFAGYAE